MVISVMSIGAVLMMGHACKTYRQRIATMEHATAVLVIAAANMWDTLTPEQIRTLHRDTVAVANGVPSWDEIRKTLADDRT